METTDEAIARASNHAEAVQPGWKDAALEFVKKFATLNERFSCEDVRLYAETKGLELPPDTRAWGAVMRLAAKNSFIRAIGFQKVNGGHQRPMTLWQSLAIPW